MLHREHDRDTVVRPVAREMSLTVAPIATSSRALAAPATEALA